jgi:hypothetical protein
MMYANPPTQMVELYKLARRHYLRKKRMESGLPTEEEEPQRRGVKFHMANTMEVWQNPVTQV